MTRLRTSLEKSPGTSNNTAVNYIFLHAHAYTLMHMHAFWCIFSYHYIGTVL